MIIDNILHATWWWFAVIAVVSHQVEFFKNKDIIVVSCDMDKTTSKIHINTILRMLPCLDERDSITPTIEDVNQVTTKSFHSSIH